MDRIHSLGSVDGEKTVYSLLNSLFCLDELLGSGIGLGLGELL